MPTEQKKNVFEPLLLFWLPFVNMFIKKNGNMNSRFLEWATANTFHSILLILVGLVSVALYRLQAQAKYILCNCRRRGRQKNLFSNCKTKTVSGVLFRLFVNDHHNINFNSIACISLFSPSPPIPFCSEHSRLHFLYETTEYASNNVARAKRKWD